NDFYFVALDLIKSTDGLTNWEQMSVEGIDDAFFYPCQFVDLNDHLVIASELKNITYRRGLLIEIINKNLEVVKSKYYFEQHDTNDGLTYLSNKKAVIKNPAGDLVVIAGQNGFSIG